MKKRCLYLDKAFLKLAAMFLLVITIAFVSEKQPVYAADDTYTVSVTDGYLALRTAKAFDSSNEIGKLYSGQTVKVQDYSDNTYWYVYAPGLGKSGYVNCNYLLSTIGSSWSVRVDNGYLALRTSKAFDSSNEIGQLYTGDTVWLYDAGDSEYWYVYSPKYKKYGFVNKEYLYGGSVSGSNETRTVRVDSGYLALRTSKAFDSANEIGQLYSGDVVQLLDTRDSAYWYVYSPKLGRSGYVNRDYLLGESTSGETRTVRVDSGYLALRAAKVFDYNNEIGELYTGDKVQIIDSSDAQYWYVYSPKHGKSGYVNKDYLNGNTAEMRTVRVDSGYLALRSAMSFDSSNEIGELYTGDTVQVMEKSNSEYWYVYSSKHGKYGYVNFSYLY